MSRRPLILVPCLAIAMVGCGAERVEPPRFDQPAKPRGSKSYRSDTGDVRFRYPANWALVEGDAPAVAHVLSGPAVLTIWSYRRRAVPKTNAQWKVARRRLIARVKRRDPDFKLDASRAIPMADAPAVEIVGRGRIGERRVSIVSDHIYKGLGEYVVDGYAPRRYSFQLERVLRKLVWTLKLGGRPETR